ncbi:cupin domain-containing protein [Propionispora vibrioides]|uniref:Gentisate 1,2-dioxygenase n=1 Tax=Propionispora vibrioides TaxID=112903 RepID=A0A1H8W5Y9_9FIRM|nr:cupin domain-containing protein [Propionispora vibrioides]SEP23030.1 gentisate 1,2-dioxygenase [Propionispora vibrioides]
MAKLVDILEKFPFEVKDKRPMLIRKSEYSTALYPPDNAFTSDNTFTMVSTDTFMLGIYELGPGGVFAPLDIHPGDESYYILNGPVVQRSGNGQFAYLQTGEGLFMPEGAWHCCHNFADSKARILYFITPKAWSENIPPAVIPSDEETKYYKGANNDKLPDMKGKIADISRQGCTDDIGAWPVDAHEARKTGAVYGVRDFEKLNNVHGTKHPMLMRFITSNDYGHFGEFVLPNGGGYGPRCSDPDKHAGDAALYCVDGPLTINLVDLQESFVMEPEDTFFIPAGTSYQLVNFENHQVKAVFAITKL